MSSVLLDNWSIERAMGLLSDDDWKRSTTNNDFMCWQNLLLAVVLWDSIRVVCEKVNTPYCYGNSYCMKILGNDVIQPLHIQSFPAFSGHDGFIEHSIYDVINDDMVMRCVREEAYPMFDNNENYNHRFTSEFQSNYDGRVDGGDIARIWLQRTQAYMNVCNDLGISYLPHPARAKYFEAIRKELVYSFNRSMVIDKVDKDVQEYYEHINNLLRVSAFHCSYPLLYDFIRRNARSPRDELEAAFEIRRDADVVEFRSIIQEIENKVSQGDLAPLDSYLSAIDDAEKRITDRFQSHKGISGEFTLALAPSLTMPFTIPVQKKFNIAFLTRLMDFGIHNRLGRES